MKNLVVFITLVTITAVSASTIDIMGTSILTNQLPIINTDTGTQLKIGNKSFLRDTMALTTKSIVRMDNNLDDANNNIALKQDNRLILDQKAENIVLQRKKKGDDDDVVILTSNALKTVGNRDTNNDLLGKKAAAIAMAARNNDQTLLNQRIGDFVDTVMAAQTETPNEDSNHYSGSPN